MTHHSGSEKLIISNIGIKLIEQTRTHHKKLQRIEENLASPQTKKQKRQNRNTASRCQGSEWNLASPQRRERNKTEIQLIEFTL